MRNVFRSFVVLALFVVGACVTINVYFPAAAAEKAAGEFIEQVIGPEGAGAPQGGRQGAWRTPDLRRLLSPVATATAQANLEIESAAVKAIQARMAERFRSTLEPAFASGALGFTNDGMVAVRDASALPLAQRSSIQAAVADENRDRAAVYREIAVANGHPEWEADIRNTFAQQWIDKARAGWWYQDASGAWKQK
jgi:uncharacterized protein YdbL (DUF1318 family)